jgi:MoxR-like ATPase
MMHDSHETPAADDVHAVQELYAHYVKLAEQLGGVIVGMEGIIEQLMIAMICRGHCILEGVPGLAKTLLVSKVAEMLGLSFRRIQFTPDLMPADITGSDVLEEDHTTGKRAFRFIKGPLFANIILADEINRTPPKTQSALLEAMQEKQVTISGQAYPLPHPFFVLATQNPIEQEGTYPLPEAQLDRFMMKIEVNYPSEAEEIAIAKRVTTDYHFDTSVVLTGEMIERMQSVVRQVPVADHVYEFAIRLARRTRPHQNGDASFIDEMVNWGAGPRASIYLLLAAKARATLRGRYHATTEDVAAMALPVLRHRVIPTFNAEAAGHTSDDIISRLVHSLATGSDVDGQGMHAGSPASPRTGKTLSRLLNRQ